MSLRIDAHHHLWRFGPEFDWIGEDMRVLRRDFLLAELGQELASAGVSATVAVQARQSLEETDWLLTLAAGQGSPICGVVGWLPIAAPTLPQVLERYGTSTLLRGLRHIVQAEPAGFLDGEAFNRGVAALQGTGLVYDILIYPHQIAEAIRFVDSHPKQAFVLDHVAKPAIRNHGMESWSPLLRQIAERPNVACKLSGMITEANRDSWTPETLQPYVEVALEAFGPERLMVGSDWPVLTVTCSYPHWWHIVEGWISNLSSIEQARILGGTASHWYRLQPQEG